MPAMLDDPTAPVIFRTSGEPPYPTPNALPPPDIMPRQVTLRDRSTMATLFPFSSPDQVPKGLIAYLCTQLNAEIEIGDTYPMIEPLPLERFGPYWFGNFGAVMLLGEIESVDRVWQMENEGKDWAKECLGSFYVKPNYPGRSSHICNGGFLVTDASRNRGVGRLMGEGYLEWAPKLGYAYSVFNLVYETNVASLRIWDALGFKRIGRVKGAGNLKSYPDRYIDAIVFGRDLNGDAEDYLSEERFDKIRYYLKTNTYPTGADRAEKSRLRSASSHYRLIPATDADEEKLMLKDKEVISDPHKQYEIAHRVHSVSHGGINKTTAVIADKYHWVRIKETVSAAIRNCEECKEVAKPAKADKSQANNHDLTSESQDQDQQQTTPPLDLSSFASPDHTMLDQSQDLQSPHPSQLKSPSSAPQIHQQAMQHMLGVQPQSHIHPDPQDQHSVPIADMSTYDYEMHMPVDPQIMDGMRQFTGHSGAQHQAQHHLHQYSVPQPYDSNGLPQAYAQHSGDLDPTAYMDHGLHGVHSGVQPMHHSHTGGGGHDYSGGDIDDEQLRHDMGQQYRSQ